MTAGVTAVVLNFLRFLWTFFMDIFSYKRRVRERAPGHVREREAARRNHFACDDRVWRFLGGDSSVEIRRWRFVGGDFANLRLFRSFLRGKFCN